MQKQNNIEQARDNRTSQRERREAEGNFEQIDFADVPEPIVATHVPLQED